MKHIFRQKVRDNHPALTLVIGNHPDNKRFYSYIWMGRDTLEKLENDIKKAAAADFESYGEIVHYGLDLPNKEVRTMMEKYYDFDHGAFLDKYQSEEETGNTSRH